MTSEAPPRRWPFGIAQTLVLALVLCLAAGAVGWHLGQRDGAESFNDADAGFLADMTVHHNGAVSLGLDYLAVQHDLLVSHYAREIVTGQSAEMAMMNLLIDDAGSPAIATDDVVMEWMGMPTDVADMPGMATEADFTALRAARGVAADDVFTRLMIVHHAAGIAMAEQAMVDGRNPRVHRLASTIATVQRTEIAQMNRRRVELGLPTVDWSDTSGAMTQPMAHGH
ncbi:MAG: DUF305 domain-containing protein [Acidimicrobiia bacterium]